MPIIEPSAESSGQTYDDNRKAMLASLNELTKVHEKMAAATAKKAESFAKKSKLLPRSRIELLVLNRSMLPLHDGFRTSGVTPPR